MHTQADHHHRLLLLLCAQLPSPLPSPITITIAPSRPDPAQPKVHIPAACGRICASVAGSAGQDGSCEMKGRRPRHLSIGADDSHHLHHLLLSLTACLHGEPRLRPQPSRLTTSSKCQNACPHTAHTFPTQRIRPSLPLVVPFVALALPVESAHHLARRATAYIEACRGPTCRIRTRPMQPWLP